MQSLWNDQEAATFGTDLLGQRVYTSRLLGRNPALVLHGGGNTSVKVEEKDFFGEPVLVVPYVMHGFILAKTSREMIKGRDLRNEGIEGMVLLKHGLFTFAEDARKSYELHIEMVTMAEQWLDRRAGGSAVCMAGGI